MKSDVDKNIEVTDEECLEHLEAQLDFITTEFDSLREKIKIATAASNFAS